MLFFSVMLEKTCQVSFRQRWFANPLGFIGFGGPAATIAMMDDEVVARRGWLSRTHFLDLVGVTNLIPGAPTPPR